ncbi:MAG: hypothetical protein GX338_09880, partial [Firmicutes bacterium]|nr:hypothetical protein [Bacillota bacterium]
MTSSLQTSTRPARPGLAVVRAGNTMTGIATIHITLVGVGTVPVVRAGNAIAGVSSLSALIAERTSGRHSSENLTHKSENSPLFFFGEI